jgi:hypothetical protein
MVKDIGALTTSTVILSLLAFLQSQPADAAVTKYQSKGAGATAYWADSCSFIGIDVGDNDTTDGSQDFLYYWGYDCNGNYFTGYGPVPEGIVKTHGGKTASLSVDVNSLTGFWHFGTPLTASITWKADGTCAEKGRSQSQTTYTYDGQKSGYKYNSTFSSVCADASGNIGGPVSFSGTTESAYIFGNRTISREFLR